MTTVCMNKANNRISTTVNFIWMSIAFSAIYWILEAVRDVVSLNKGDIVERIFAPDLLSIGMRLMVIMLLLLFGAYAESVVVRRQATVSKTKKIVLPEIGKMIWAGFGFALLYWVLEAVRDVIAFERGTFLERLLVSDLMGIGTRLLAICVLLLFSVYAQNLVNEKLHAEKMLKKTQEKLERMVAERTEALLHSNDLLRQEISERKRFELESQEVNRALKTLTACNEVLVRATDENMLLDQICHKIVYVGGYDLVWVVLTHQNESIEYEIMSHASVKNEDFSIINSLHQSDEFTESPVGYAIRHQKPILLENLNSIENALSESWVYKAKDCGYQSMISLPLTHQQNTFGTLNILCLNKNQYDDEEVRLLRELANDLAYGMIMVRTRIEHEKSEKEKVAIQAQLLQSQKMEAVGMLAGGVAHDFNNLLTAIQVSADLGMMEVPDDSPAYKEFYEIHQVTSHAAELAKQLLLFSRKHPMEPNAIDLNTIVENLQKMLKRLIGEGVIIQNEFETQLWNVWADQGTIEQVIVNLVVNARDAVEGNGTIKIKSENMRLNKTMCRQIPNSRPGKYVRLSIEDDGKGMSRDVIQRIFEPFFSTKGPGKGTGLGLSVVYGILQEHDGFINVKSEPGVGSRFEIYLPAIYLKPEEKSHTPVAPAIINGDGKHVLYIEDEEKVRAFTSKGLQMNGYNVFVAGTGEEAESMFNQHSDYIDIIFSDIVLPDGSGIVLSDKLAKKKIDVKVLLSSGYADQNARWPEIKEKGFTYLQKPYTLSDLLKKLQYIHNA